MSSSIFISCVKYKYARVHTAIGSFGNECASFSTYTSKVLTSISLSLLFVLFLLLRSFLLRCFLYLPFFLRLIFLGVMQISSMARFRSPLEASHSTMPLVAPFDHNRPLCHCQSTLTSAITLLAKNQVRPGNIN